MTRTSLFLPDDAASDRLGAVLARLLQAGDVVLLSGPVGAGKTHIARALIRTRLGRMEDVPSPTFTLVQTYESQPDIWHADLYRITNPDEVTELGLDAAFDTAICLIEWPERLGDLVPPDALHLHLATADDGRTARFSGGRPGLLAALMSDWTADD